ncbi:MAG TPA: nucleoside hydrolase [Anaerolineales bacterium]|nr:nucleoside hydrolase [Anaerolineales bacterium]
MTHHSAPARQPIPVVLDTDIGTDIDDTWALAFLLRCPELDVRLITTATGDTFDRARLVARLLEIAGRADIPIGIGIPLEPAPNYQQGWVGDYALARYPGQVFEDGVGALADTIRQSATPVTVIGIGPLPNIAALLQRAPDVAALARFIGMFGSLRRGYFGSTEIPAEYNVKLYPYACRHVFAAPWPITISPLDTCGSVQLAGERYQTFRSSPDPLARAVMENYLCWTLANQNPLYRGFDPDRESSILFDLVPIYLAMTEEWVTIEALRIDVTAEGRTREDPAGNLIRCATDWVDRSAFEDFVLARIVGRT